MKVREESEKVGLKLKDPNIRKTKIMGWYFHFFQNFPQFIVIHTVKGSGIVNKAEIDVFLELSSKNGHRRNLPQHSKGHIW